MSKIWDAHSHWMPPEVAEKTTFFRQGWSDIDLLLQTLDNSGVEKAVLLYPTSDAHLNLGGWSRLCDIYNKAISKKVKEHPQRLIGAGILPADRPGDMVQEIERIKELGLSCLSLASSYEGKYLDEESFLPVFEKAEKEKLPIFVHSQIINPIGSSRVKDPLLMPVVEYLFDITMSAGRLMMSGLLSRLKNLKIVFVHFAGVVPFLIDRFDATYLMLRRRNIVQDLGAVPSAILKNIFVDISGVKSATMLKMALESFGP
ncbi:MAG: amidohydrolase family protein, partial [Omnitrophica bacterium]|nr:amidohydrolase family protein [Candidatus Omnitrophota bacterium]